MPAVAAAERAQDPDDAREGVRLIKLSHLRTAVTSPAAYAALSASTSMEAFVSSANSKESQPATSKTGYAASKQRVNL